MPIGKAPKAGRLGVRAPELHAARAGFACPAAESYSRITNYGADAGAGSQIITNMSESSTWRAALLGTVAAGALWLYSPRVARAGPDACDVAGTTAYCQGNQSDGIASDVDFIAAVVDTLYVYNLIENPANPGSGIAIEPAAGVDGIFFHRDAGDITIYSDTRPYAISVYGADADGIDAMAPGTITIEHAGDITSEDGRGISAYSTGGAVSVALDGNIDAAAEGIFARGVGGVTVTTTDDNTVTGGS